MASDYSEDKLIQQTTAFYLNEALKWESVYAYNDETFGPGGLLCEKKNDLSARARSQVKKIAQELIEKIKVEIAKVDNWRAKTATQAQVQAMIYDYLYDEQTGLPLDAYTSEDVKSLAEELFQHVYVQYPDAVENVYFLTV